MNLEEDPLTAAESWLPTGKTTAFCPKGKLEEFQNDIEYKGFDEASYWESG